MLIVFEGVDFSGKTTLIKWLTQQLQTQYPAAKLVITRQPDMVKVRQMLNLRLEKYHDRGTDLFYFLLDRHLNLKEVIEPALQNQQIVICDRYFYSSLVYQGILKNKNFHELIEVHRLLGLMRLPDVVIFLNPPLITLKNRLNAHQVDQNKFDHLTIHNLEVIKTGYETVFAHFRQNHQTIIELTTPILSTLKRQLWQKLQRLLPK